MIENTSLREANYIDVLLFAHNLTVARVVAKSVITSDTLLPYAPYGTRACRIMPSTIVYLCI